MSSVFDQEAVLHQVLDRHQNVMVVEPGRGLPTLVRRDELLVAGHDLPAVEDHARRWCEPATGLAADQAGHGGSGVIRLRLRAQARVDVCELAAQLRDGATPRALSVSPNHLVYGQPLWWTGPAAPPRPCPALAAPACRAGERPVEVAVLDTGLSAHPWWDDTEWFAAQRDDVAEILDANHDHRLDTHAGHGTFIAGVILQRSPSARIRALRVIGGDGFGDELGVIRAVAGLSATGRPDIANLSFGCHTYDDRPSPLMARAISALHAGSGAAHDGAEHTGAEHHGTVIVACAGNAGSERPFWPAALKQVVAVGALDGDERALFSNHGWWVDACAQGVDVPSCFVRFDGPLTGAARPGAEAGGEPDDADPDRFDGYATWSGTSFAAPTVAGAIAALAASEGLSAVAAAGRVLDPALAVPRPDLGLVVR